MKSKRKIIGFLGTDLTVLNTGIQNQIWQGAMQARQQYDLHFVYFPIVRGYRLDFNDVRIKTLINFIDKNYIDGLLFWYGGIKETFITGNDIQLLNTIRELPLVTIGGQLEHHPDISVDNYQGMRAAVEHLIKEHNRCNIAFIRGSEGHWEAEQRFQGYMDALHAHNIAVDDRLIAQGTFQNLIGNKLAQEAVKRWLEDPNIQFDSVVAASDYMAQGVISALQTYGVTVPDDVAVIGFDDVHNASASTPSLTTVKQPFYAIGQQATETLLALINGKEDIPELIGIPAEFIPRESCGCMTTSMALVNATNPLFDLTIRDKPQTQNLNWTLLAQELIISAQQFEALYHLFLNDVQGEQPQQFLDTLKHYLLEDVTTPFDNLAWQNIISTLRGALLASAQEGIGTVGESIFHQARVMITEIGERFHIAHYLEIEVMIEELRDTSEYLSISYGQELLTETLHKQLPILGYSDFHLALYSTPDQPQNGCVLIFAYEQNKLVELPTGGIHLPTTQLIKRFIANKQTGGTFIVESLYFQNQQHGVLIFELNNMTQISSETLRIQISNALQGTNLLQQIQNHTLELEARVAERTHELTETIQQLQTVGAQRELAEESLRLVNFAIERVSDAVYWLDETLKIININQAACSLLGYRHDQLVGMLFADIDAVFSETVWSRIQQKIRDEGSMTIETEHRSQSRRIIPVEIVINYIVFGDQHLYCIFARDITQRKKSEQILRNREEHAREFQDKLKTLQEVSLKLASTSSVNKFCEAVIEFGRNDLGYERIGLLLLEDRDTSTVNKFGIQATGELRTEYNVYYDVKQDTVLSTNLLTNPDSVWVDEVTNLYDFNADVVGRGWNIIAGIWEGDSCIGWLAADNLFEKKPLIPYQVELLVIYSLTVGHLLVQKRVEAEIHQLNEELEQRVLDRTIKLQDANDRLQALSQMKDEFVSNVSHELKTPITNMKLYHHLLENKPERYQYYIDILRRDTDRLENLIEALLMLSRFDQQRQELSRVPINLRKLITDFVNDRKELATAKGIELVTEVSKFENALVMIQADYRLLEQVLSILVTNALAYTPSNGKIVVNVEQQVSDDERWAGFSVRDTGPGIPKDEQENLFERFFRGSIGRTSSVPGTGLGLSIAKEIIDRHQGYITVDSDGMVRQGTTFFVWLKPVLN